MGAPRALAQALASECRVLSRLVYKNRNQHRRARYFQATLQVHRQLAELEASAPVEAVLDALEGNTPAASSAPTAPPAPIATAASSAPAASGAPSATEAADAHALRHAWRWMQAVDTLVTKSLLPAARLLLGLLSQGFFMPLALTLLCILGRVRRLLLHLQQHLAGPYNACSARLSPGARAALEAEGVCSTIQKVRCTCCPAPTPTPATTPTPTPTTAPTTALSTTPTLILPPHPHPAPAPAVSESNDDREETAQPSEPSQPSQPRVHPPHARDSDAADATGTAADPRPRKAPRLFTPGDALAAPCPREALALCTPGNRDTAHRAEAPGSELQPPVHPGRATGGTSAAAPGPVPRGRRGDGQAERDSVGGAGAEEGEGTDGGSRGPAGKVEVRADMEGVMYGSGTPGALAVSIQRAGSSGLLSSTSGVLPEQSTERGHEKSSGDKIGTEGMSGNTKVEASKLQQAIIDLGFEDFL